MLRKVLTSPKPTAARLWAFVALGLGAGALGLVVRTRTGSKRELARPVSVGIALLGLGVTLLAAYRS